MAWFRRRKTDPTEADEHVRPVEIDLGLRKEWEVEMQVERLKDMGLTAYLVAQSDSPKLGSLMPKRCHVYTRPEHELQVRAELASAGLL